LPLYYKGSLIIGVYMFLFGKTPVDWWTGHKKKIIAAAVVVVILIIAI